jgi:hypothetical protein
MTAVEQFIEKLEDQELWQNMSMQTINISIKIEDYLKLIEQAKQMEKKQIEDAYENGVKETNSRCEYQHGEQYYNETFKSE